MSSNIIEATPYSCVSDMNNLLVQKQAIDYHIKNAGNPAKSTVTPTQLKKLQDDYDVAKKKYDASDCGKDVERDSCIALNAQITSMRATIAYFRSVRDDETANKRTVQLEELIKKFNDSKCGAKIGEFRAGVLGSISETYQELDKKRIEAESKYQVKQKIFFGAIVLAGALLIITMFGKKN